MEYINSFKDLQRIKRRGEYELLSDIDCGGKIIKCLLGDFSGKIYGNGHSITNLVLSDEIWGDEQFLALFYTATKTEIQDIMFDNISLKYDQGCYHPRIAALFVSCSNSIVKNVTVRITSSDEEIPLIYEANDCMINNVLFTINGIEGTVVKYNISEEI